jgi:hypothetical protein
LELKGGIKMKKSLVIFGIFTLIIVLSLSGQALLVDTPEVHAQSGHTLTTLEDWDIGIQPSLPESWWVYVEIHGTDYSTGNSETLLLHIGPNPD